MTRRMGLTGNEAVALAWKQLRPHVVAAYPITPATQIVERFSEYVAHGEVDTEFVPVESEHSALSACVGAAAAGARVLTATASQGLALMHEVLYIASGLRLPIVMNVATGPCPRPSTSTGTTPTPWGPGTRGGCRCTRGTSRTRTTGPCWRCGWRNARGCRSWCAWTGSP